MPGIDYNADKEGHREKVYAVVRADTNLESVETSKGTMSFGKSGAFAVKDPVLANEIRDTLGPKGVVAPLVNTHPSDQGHRYHFGGMPEMPWHRAERLRREAEEREANGQAAQATSGAPSGDSGAGEERTQAETP